MDQGEHSKPLTARRSGHLMGEATPPGDKSVSHRALILGALTVGETAISGLLEAEDVLNTAAAMRRLGADVVRESGGRWRVHGVGVGGWAEPKEPLDFGNELSRCELEINFDGHANSLNRWVETTFPRFMKSCFQ